MYTVKKWAMYFSLLLLAAFIFPVSTVEALQAETFLPNPGLRITVTGILGSDGTRFDSSLVTARLGGEALVTYAEEALTYYEHNKSPIDAAKDRTVWRYAATVEGIEKVPLVSNRKQKSFLWLPQNPEVGASWKASWGNRREVMETGLTVETAAGVFEGCIMVEYDVYAGGTGIERHYLAPGVGLVKIVSLKGPKATKGATWYEVTRIQQIDPAQAKQIIATMMQ